MTEELKIEDLIDLCIFLANTHNETEKIFTRIINSEDDNLTKDYIIDNWPLIQGINNKIYIEKLGNCKYNTENLTSTLKLLTKYV